MSVLRAAATPTTSKRERAGLEPEPTPKAEAPTPSPISPFQLATSSLTDLHHNVRVSTNTTPRLRKQIDHVGILKSTKRKATSSPAKRKRLEDASGPPDRLFTPPPAEERRGVKDGGERGEGGEEVVSVPRTKTKAATVYTPSANTNANARRRQQGSLSKPAPVQHSSLSTTAMPVEGPPLDRILTPTPEPEPVEEVQKQGSLSLVRSGVMTMVPAAKARAIPFASSSSSLPPPPPRKNRSVSSSSSGTGTGMEKSKLARGAPRPVVGYEGKSQTRISGFYLE
ncbi:hypothetical protein PQX77_014451 [Marasmius sp. AFHP31]|nr:hypothetical protein PQX77_014451 [Marasmius sp. AFHP31]